MSLIRRVARSFFSGDNPEIGEIFTDESGVTWLVMSHGTRVQLGAGGGSEPAIQASAGISSSSIAGGINGLVNLIPGGTFGGEYNLLTGCQGGWVYAASHKFILAYNPVTWTTGTLEISYAELDICNADGSERMAAGLDTPFALASGVGGTIVLDDNAEAPGNGADLVLQGDGSVETTAGGLFIVTFLVQFNPSN